MGCNRGSELTKPVHSVTLTRDYYMCDHEVTQAEFLSVMGTNPSKFTSDAAAGEVQENRPVENVGWYKAFVYCNKLSMSKNITPCYKINDKTDPAEWGAIPEEYSAVWNAVVCDWDADGYRLPTEAEWEYAARAGDTIVNTYTWSGTSDENKFENFAWYYYNSENKTHEVKKTPGGANAWGLYDMSGNVAEMCWDRWQNDPYSSEAVTDPTGNSTSNCRISRGGNYNLDSDACAVASREAGVPYIMSDFPKNFVGFRVVRTAK